MGQASIPGVAGVTVTSRAIVVAARAAVVPSSGPLYLSFSGVTNSSSGLTFPRTGNITSLSVTVDSADGSRDYDLDVVRDPTGTPVSLTTLALPSGSRSAYSSSLSISITAGWELGLRMVRTSGSGDSTFNDIVAAIEVEYL